MCIKPKNNRFLEIISSQEFEAELDAIELASKDNKYCDRINKNLKKLKKARRKLISVLKKMAGKAV